MLPFRLSVFPIRLFADNYSYLVLNNANKFGFLVDPAKPDKVLEFLEDFESFEISSVLYTHKHWDHASGSRELFERLSCRLKDPSVQLTFWASSVEAEEIDFTNRTFGKVSSCPSAKASP